MVEMREAVFLSKEDENVVQNNFRRRHRTSAVWCGASDRIVADCLGRSDWNVGGGGVNLARVGSTVDFFATGG